MTHDLTFWVDGARVLDPQRRAMAGAGIVGFSDGTALGWSIPLGPATNQQAELRAVQEALLRVRDRWNSRVTVCTDSAYAIGALLGRMKAKTNLGIIEDIQKLIADCWAFHLEKCSGHAGLLWNEHADRLAKQAARTQKRSIEELGER